MRFFFPKSGFFSFSFFASKVFLLLLHHLSLTSRFPSNKKKLTHSFLQITWVAPRVLTLPQVADLAGRLRSWLAKVDAASSALEAEGGVAALAVA